MKFVLDTSVALKWYLPEPDSSKAAALRDDFRNAIHELIAPDIFPTEAAHGLARAERRRIILPPQGTRDLTSLLSTLPALYPSLPLLSRAFQIASQARIGVYDCLYVALAERESCAFVTADDRLVRNLQGAFPFIVSLSSLP